MAQEPSLRKLGRSELRVTPIGLGCWQFSGRKNIPGKFWPLLSQEQIQEIISVSLKGGVNWFDTAEAYGGGESEINLSRSLKRLGINPGDVYIATKWTPMLRTAATIHKTIGERLDCLDGFGIDIHQVHNPFYLSSTRSVMTAMAELVKMGRIRYIGVSNFSAKRMRKAHAELRQFGLELVSNQVKYSLLARKIESNGVLDTAKELGISIIAYSPLSQGVLSGKFHDQPALLRGLKGFRKFMPEFWKKNLEKSRPVVEALKELAEKYQVSTSQVALNWVLYTQGASVVAIPGATKAEQAREDAAAMRFRLNDDELDHLNTVSVGFK